MSRLDQGVEHDRLTNRYAAARVLKPFKKTEEHRRQSFAPRQFAALAAAIQGRDFRDCIRKRWMVAGLRPSSSVPRDKLPAECLLLPPFHLVAENVKETQLTRLDNVNTMFCSAGPDAVVVPKVKADLAVDR